MKECDELLISYRSEVCHSEGKVTKDKLLCYHLFGVMDRTQSVCFFG